jgi:hypothetical protein
MSKAQDHLVKTMEIFQSRADADIMSAWDSALITVSPSPGEKEKSYQALRRACGGMTVRGWNKGKTKAEASTVLETALADLTVLEGK